jgi:hypothetical protein
LASLALESGHVHLLQELLLAAFLRQSAIHRSDNLEAKIFSWMRISAQGREQTFEKFELKAAKASRADALDMVQACRSYG